MIPSVVPPQAAQPDRNRAASEKEESRAWLWPRKVAKSDSVQCPSVAERASKGWFAGLDGDSDDEADHNDVAEQREVRVARRAAGPLLPPPQSKVRPSTARSSCYAVESESDEEPTQAKDTAPARPSSSVGESATYGDAFAATYEPSATEDGSDDRDDPAPSCVEARCEHLICRRARREGRSLAKRYVEATANAAGRTGTTPPQHEARVYRHA